jgi:hypothetical protein
VMPIPAKEDMSFPWETNCFVPLEIQVFTD